MLIYRKRAKFHCGRKRTNGHLSSCNGSNENNTDCFCSVCVCV
uniref:Uncharacterized protein n=1 Tax=Anguilla anguilla TaxID=7936 RepID=A0A0E9VKK4_ANGAN